MEAEEWPRIRPINKVRTPTLPPKGDTWVVGLRVGISRSTRPQEARSHRDTIRQSPEREPHLLCYSTHETPI